VPDEEPTVRNSEDGQKDNEFIWAGYVPRLNEKICSPEGQLKSRITVPVLEAVARMLPDRLNSIATTALLWAVTLLNRRRATQSYKITSPGNPPGKAIIDVFSLDSAINPVIFGLVASTWKQITPTRS